MSPRADHVGSFLRPLELLAARENSDGATLKAMEDKHVLRVLTKQKELGFEIFTDGELHRRNFMSNFTDAVEGFDLAPKSRAVLKSGEPRGRCKRRTSAT